MDPEQELRLKIAQMLVATARVLETNFPKDPLIICCGQPDAPLAFFLCLWRNTGDRGVDTIPFRK